MLVRTTFLALAAVGIALAIFPYKSQVCPSWHVRVVDESQRPVAGLTVRLSYQNYSAESRSHEVDVVSDDGGDAIFPAATVRVSIARRCLFTLLSAGTGVHASFGPHAWVFAFGKGLEGTAVDPQRNVIDWTGRPSHMESVIVVKPQKP